jgi:glycerol-3-phosphate acyltransferase PlsY
MFVLWLLMTYLSGALPWSVWLGRLFFRVDPRQQADRNPGAANAFRAAGWRLGVAVLALDFLKAFVPVLVAARGIGFDNGELFWIALMPTLGHAFSIFLRFRGGRALVVMFGVWAGLTLYEAPLVMGAAAVLTLVLLRSDERRTLVIPLVLIVYLAVQGAPVWMMGLAAAQMLVTALKMGASALLPGTVKAA